MKNILPLLSILAAASSAAALPQPLKAVDATLIPAAVPVAAASKLTPAAFTVGVPQGADVALVMGAKQHAKEEPKAVAQAPKAVVTTEEKVVTQSVAYKADGSEESRIEAASAAQRSVIPAAEKPATPLTVIGGKPVRLRPNQIPSQAAQSAEKKDDASTASEPAEESSEAVSQTPVVVAAPAVVASPAALASPVMLVAPAVVASPAVVAAPVVVSPVAQGASYAIPPSTPPQEPTDQKNHMSNILAIVTIPGKIDGSSRTTTTTYSDSFKSDDDVVDNKDHGNIDQSEGQTNTRGRNDVTFDNDGIDAKDSRNFRDNESLGRTQNSGRGRGGYRGSEEFNPLGSGFNAVDFDDFHHRGYGHHDGLTTPYVPGFGQDFDCDHWFGSHHNSPKWGGHRLGSAHVHEVEETHVEPVVEVKTEKKDMASSAELAGVVVHPVYTTTGFDDGFDISECGCNCG